MDGQRDAPVELTKTENELGQEGRSYPPTELSAARSTPIRARRCRGTSGRASGADSPRLRRPLHPPSTLVSSTRSTGRSNPAAKANETGQGASRTRPAPPRGRKGKKHFGDEGRRGDFVRSEGAVGRERGRVAAHVHRYVMSVGPQEAMSDNPGKLVKPARFHRLHAGRRGEKNSNPRLRVYRHYCLVPGGPLRGFDSP